MLSDQLNSVIHFHHLAQPQLNLLLRVTKRLSVGCCYLGYQAIRKEDFIILSSSIKLSEIEEIREKYENLIFLVTDKKIGAYEVNQYNKLGNICFIDEICYNEISTKINSCLQSRKSENDQDEGEALAIISHDLKNPLNAIRLDAQLLLRNAKKSQSSPLSIEVKKLATRIMNTSDRLNFMVSGLLEVNKSKKNALNSLTRSKVRVDQLLDEVIDVLMPVAMKKNLAFEKNVENDFPDLSVDKNKIFQVFLNLLTNALKFSKPNSTIFLNLTLSDNRLNFSVEDSGPGVKDEIFDKIYDKYFSGKDEGEGTGLGLYICKTIIEAHRGYLGHENRNDGGARFYFSLPFQPEVNLGTKKIYLIDDDEDLRDVLSWVLNGEGYDVESFSGPMKALDSMAKALEKPSLILSDFQMSGMRVKEFLDKKNTLELQNIPVLILTASPIKAAEELIDNTYLQVLTKPLNLDDLMNTVAHYMSTTSIQRV